MRKIPALLFALCMIIISIPMESQVYQQNNVIIQQQQNNNINIQPSSNINFTPPPVEPAQQYTLPNPYEYQWIEQNAMSKLTYGEDKLFREMSTGIPSILEGAPRYYTKTTANLRSRPGTDSPIIAQMPKDSYVLISNSNYSSGGWYYVWYIGGRVEGFVSSSLLVFDPIK